VDTILPRLHVSAPEALGFGPALQIRAFLLQLEEGNLLVYRARTLEQEAQAIGDLGGIWRQYLNHRHEASPVCAWVSQTFGAPLFCHEAEAPTVSGLVTVGGTFSERHRVGEDFEVIPTPGHTPGATAFLWETDGHRVLFTGDTVMFSRGSWVAAVLAGSSDRDHYLESLELIRDLDSDVLAPSVTSSGEPAHARVDREEAERRIDAILERVRRGESG
jgi:glyoxylase-like metal-dependent hydrolase (beta-lactamase superfamily II)